jgi:hypothetical protein
MERTLTNYTYAFLVLFFCTWIFAFVHEIGHGLWSLMLGYSIEDWYIPMIPMRNGWIDVGYISNERDLILILLMGSFFSFAVGNFLLLVIYKFKLHPFLEFGGFCFGLMLSLDLLVYNLFDVFWLRIGDWYDLYQLNPIINLFSLLIGIIHLMVLAKTFQKVYEKMDL